MKTSKRCDGVTRRNFVRIGGLTALGLGMSDFFQLQRAMAANPLSNAKAKSCILIWLDGGASHLDTFDPKPQAPSEVRGPFDSINTQLTGIRISEHMPETAKMLDKMALIRSVTSPFGVHNFAAQYLMTGYKPTPALEYPSIASVVAHLRTQTDVLPSNIAIPNLISRDAATIGNGFLPNSTKHFSLGSDPGKSSYEVRDLDFYQGLDISRLDRRRKIVNAMNEFGNLKSKANGPSDPDLERAYNLIASTEAKTAFNLEKEPLQVRERYSIDPRANLHDSNNIGQQCLLARRMVERGVPFVTVNNTGWDNHLDLKTYANRNPGDLRSASHALIPGLDKALSALIGDLSERGMLDETLVLVMTDFGRTPKINSTGGRDHWPNCFSVAMAGGGVKGGQVIGASDALGEFVQDRPITPGDLSSTIYTFLGIDPGHELITPDGRPIRVAPQDSKVIKELLA
ncbi:MAG: DUF1501 domain-containing protein [Pirellulaceae bacterium]|nr:DUF1501 domain-containing protein [Pirellulaceae bacterium]MDG2104413.1 DUF1501 domain-containing protein [Pirellulaceae bacterium]